MNLVAADVSPLHLKSRKVRADSRRLLRFRGSIRESFRGILSPALSSIRWRRGGGGGVAGQGRFDFRVFRVFRGSLRGLAVKRRWVLFAETRGDGRGWCSPHLAG